MRSPSVAVTQLVDLLKQQDERLVLAESCTAGLASAEISMVAGVSDSLCGSAVTYRCATKTKWLGVDAQLIEKETAVCPQVAHQMAKGVLQITPEATIAASITGHLGPDAPDELDGVVFIGIARKQQDDIQVHVAQHQLQELGRTARQIEAVGLIVQELSKTLK